jgi:hypothetical protein
VLTVLVGILVVLVFLAIFPEVWKLIAGVALVGYVVVVGVIIALFLGWRP